MSNENAGQVLLQIQEPLRSTPIRPGEAALLAFQLLVWAELSNKGRLESESSLEGAIKSGAAGIVDALQRLAVEEGSVGQAFSGAPRNARTVGEYIVQASMVAKRLIEGGIFERFSPVAIATDQLAPSQNFPSLPSELADLMVHLAVGADSKRIYCPWESSGQFIGALLEHTGTVTVEGSGQEAMPALMSLLRKAPTELETTDPLRNPSSIKSGHLQHFDASLSFPPMGVWLADDVAIQDIYGRFPVKKATATGLMVQHIVASTKGRAAVIVPNSFLFGPGKDREVREYLLGSGYLEAVIMLPVGIHQMTNVPTALLILNPGSFTDRVGFLDATLSHFSKQPAKGKVTLDNIHDIRAFLSILDGEAMLDASPLDDSMAKVIHTEEILENDASLQVSRYVMGSEQRDLQAQLETMQTVALDEVAEFIQPVPNKDRASDSPVAVEVHEVGAADLPPYGYIRKPEKSIKVSLSSRKSGSANDVFLRPFDLVLIIKGSTGKIGIVPDNVPPPGEGGWIAGQSAIVLRSKEPNRDLRGLGLWLRSKMGQQLLDSIRSGAAIQMFSVNTLRRLKVIAETTFLAETAVDVLEKEYELQLQIEGLQIEQASISEDYWAEVFSALGQNA
jgi:type I restriction enzyme M protein